MSTQVLLYDTIRINVVFRDWSSGGSGSVVDPDTVTVYSALTADIAEAPAEPPTGGELGRYYYDWTPVVTGHYTIKFVGSFTYGPDSQDIVVFEDFNVLEQIGQTNSLGEAQELVFASDVYPLYVDPEEFMPFYPEATLVEVMELVHRYSKEVDNFYNGKEIDFTAEEYIRAAVQCALARTYDFGMVGGAESLTLGDLSISNQSYPKTSVTRGNAANACELAAALRGEMVRTSGSARMRSVISGSSYKNPMPTRQIRHPGGRK